MATGVLVRLGLQLPAQQAAWNALSFPAMQLKAAPHTMHHGEQQRSPQLCQSAAPCCSLDLLLHCLRLLVVACMHPCKTCVRVLCRPASSYPSEQPDNGLEREASLGALAAEADSMEDKLKLVETKRK